MRWLAYLERRGAGDLLSHEEQLRTLTTPAPKDEAAANRVRMADATRMREHIAALRAAIYPPDEEPADG